MSDHRARVDELLAEYRRSKEHLAGVHRELGAIRESATSRDGAITATASSKGTLVGLTIAEDAYTRYTPSQLAAQIVGVTSVATTKALTRASEILAPALPAGTDPQALLLGTGDLRPEEIVPEQTQRASAQSVRPESAARASEADFDEEDDFEQHSWVAEGWRER